MTPQKQTKVTTADQHGNCFSACLASLLDVSIDTVPDFSNIENWHDEYERFLSDNGYEHNGCDTLGEWMDSNTFYIVGGYSPRGTSRGHAVIYKGTKPFFDPHPVNTFLTKPNEVYLIGIKSSLK